MVETDVRTFSSQWGLPSSVYPSTWSILFLQVSHRNVHLCSTLRGTQTEETFPGFTHGSLLPFGTFFPSLVSVFRSILVSCTSLHPPCPVGRSYLPDLRVPRGQVRGSDTRYKPTFRHQRDLTKRVVTLHSDPQTRP